MPRAETGCDSKELTGAQAADKKSREIEFEGSWIKINLQVVSETAPQNGRRQNGAAFMGHLLGGRDGARREEIRDVQQSMLGGKNLNSFQESFTSYPRHLFTELILQLLKVLTEHFFKYLVACYSV